MRSSAWLLGWLALGVSCGSETGDTAGAHADAGDAPAVDAGEMLLCEPPTGLYRIVAMELEGDCGDFEGVAQLGAQSDACDKNTVYRDAGCTIDLDTVCEQEEADGSVTTRRTMGTVRRARDSVDYSGIIEFAIRSSVETPCSGTFELRYESVEDPDASM